MACGLALLEYFHTFSLDFSRFSPEACLYQKTIQHNDRASHWRTRH